MSHSQPTLEGEETTVRATSSGCLQSPFPPPFLPSLVGGSVEMLNAVLGGNGVPAVERGQEDLSGVVL